MWIPDRGGMGGMIDPLRPGFRRSGRLDGRTCAGLPRPRSDSTLRLRLRR